MNYTKLTECLACGSNNIIPTLNLGNQPLANSYTKYNAEALPEYPLELNRCSVCSHVQLSVAVNPDLMFKDYLYVSGTSKTLLDYFSWFSRYTNEYLESIYQPTKAFCKNVLDIGCNDGSMLDAFKKLGYSTQGIDPAENIYPLSSKNHDVICGYFDATNIDKLVSPNIIVAQNVFAHNYNPIEFMKNIESIMDDETLVFVQTSQANMILNNEYDTCYHEHISFYNIKSMKALCDRSGLFLVDVIKTPIHGYSYVFVISKDHTLDRTANIENLIKLEELSGLYSEETYKKYENNCVKSAHALRNAVNGFRERGYNIIGYGAAAKGNTLLNFAKLELDYIIDDNPLKWDLYTPGMQIPIVSKDILNNFKDTDKILFIPLAWNFFTEIRNNIRDVRDNVSDIFLLYFPEVKILYHDKYRYGMV